MHGMLCVEKEERLLRRVASVLLNELATLLQKHEIHLLHREIRRDVAWPAIIGIRMLGQLRFIDEASWRNGDAVALNERIKPIRGGTTGRAEEVIETDVERPTLDPARVVDSQHVLQSATMNRCACFVSERQSHVPFANCRRRVALLL